MSTNTDGDQTGGNESTSVVDTSGDMNLNSSGEGGHKTTVEVTRHCGCVGLRLSNEIAAIDVALLPEDIEPLCEELLAAKENVREPNVEETREWITEEFR